jgi:hypothetical protein
MEMAEEIDGARINLFRLKDAVRMDVELGALEQSEPLGFVAPAHGSFAHEVAHTLQQGWPRGEVEDDASRVRSALREGHANYSAKLLRG